MIFTFKKSLLMSLFEVANAALVGKFKIFPPYSLYPIQPFLSGEIFYKPPSSGKPCPFIYLFLFISLT